MGPLVTAFQINEHKQDSQLCLMNTILRMRPRTLRSPQLLRRETPRKRCPGGREDARGAVCYTAELRKPTHARAPPGAPSPVKLRQTYPRDAFRRRTKSKYRKRYKHV